MDIAAVATGLSEARLGNQIAVEVAKKGMDAAKQEGEAAIQLLESAAEVAASPDGVGTRIDARG
jgi:hypothetical protein